MKKRDAVRFQTRPLVCRFLPGAVYKQVTGCASAGLDSNTTGASGEGALYVSDQLVNSNYRSQFTANILQPRNKYLQPIKIASDLYKAPMETINSFSYFKCSFSRL